MRISSKSLVAKLYWQLVVTCLLALLVHEPSQKLANGQLEAVGAVLSVVPVTSILATAGLVGVKLAALSRLLNILGYDRAYLAQNLGTGTAAAPIGLQTRYAYMFPYVPGLNISVKGDDSIGMPKEAVTELAEDGTKVGGGGGAAAVAAGGAPVAGGLPPRRKTYPAMSLPGDYEHQLKPFRGSEALKGIFNKAGLQVHIPTAEQQQQMQQQFNLPAQGKDQSNYNNFYNNNQQQHYHSNMHLSKPNDNDPNRNDKQQLHSHILQQQQPTYKDQPPITTNDHQQQQPQQPHEPAGSLISNQSGNSVAPSNSNVAPNRPMESSSSSSQPGASIGAPSGGDQPASKPSSSNSHQPNQQPTSSNNNNSQSQTGTGQAAAAVGTATQVIMQHPNNDKQILSKQQKKQRRPPVGSGDGSGGVLRGPLSVATDERGDNRQASPGASLSSLHYGHHAVIPQRDQFAFMANRKRPDTRGKQQQQQQTKLLNVGLLSRPGPVIGPLESNSIVSPIEAVQLIPGGGRQPIGRGQPQNQPPATAFHSAVADSFKPGRHPELAHQFQARQPDLFDVHHHHHHQQGFRPTVASQGPGFSPIPNEMSSTNFFPRPFDFDDMPALFGDRSNELDRTQPQRRRKRSPTSSSSPIAASQSAAASSAPLSDPVLGSAQAAGGHQQQAMRQQAPGSSNSGQGVVARQQDSMRPSGSNFGMPVSNINTLRRRRRQVGLFGLA